MSVALELEYEEFLSQVAGRAPDVPERGRGLQPPVQRRRLILGAVVVVLLVLLMLPHPRARRQDDRRRRDRRAGQEYVVHSGDTLASIAARVGCGNVAGMEQQIGRMRQGPPCSCRGSIC